MKHREMFDLAYDLLGLLDEAVPEGPTWWNGVPEGYTFPVDPVTYGGLHSGLYALLKAMEEIIAAKEDEADAQAVRS